MSSIDHHRPSLHDDRACVFCHGREGGLEHTAMFAMCGACCEEGVDVALAHARTPREWSRVIRRARRWPRVMRCGFCRANEVPADLVCIAMCDDCCREGVDLDLAEARTPIGRWLVFRRVRRRRRRS